MTVEAICEQADISRSTFFNYFAGRDYAIVGRALRPLEPTATAAVFASAPGDLIRGVYRLIFASIGHTYVQSEVARKRAQLIAEQPLAQQMITNTRGESTTMLVEATTQWLTDHPEERRLTDAAQEARLAVSLAYHAATTLVAQSAGAEGDIETNEDCLDEVIEQARRLVTVPA